MPAGLHKLAIDRRHADAVAELAIANLVFRNKGAKKESPWAKYVDDPVGFVTDVLGEKLWS